MKKDKNLMLLLAAGAAYWYFFIYLKKKKSTIIEKTTDEIIEEELNAPNIPEIIPAQPRLEPTGYQSDVVMDDYANTYNVKYTMSGTRKLGRVPNTI
jgi:hypothetical protein